VNFAKIFLSENILGALLLSMALFAPIAGRGGWLDIVELADLETIISVVRFFSWVKEDWLDGGDYGGEAG